MFVLVVSACSAPDGDSAAASLPSAYEYAADTLSGVEDPTGMQADIQYVIDNLRSYNAGPVLEAWYEAHRYSDERCPEEVTTTTEANGTVVYFDGQCVSQDRYWFKGPMSTYTFADNTLRQFELSDTAPYLLDNTALWTGQALKGQTDIFDEDSDLDYNCSCTGFRAVSATDPTSLQWMSYMDGPAHWVSPTSDPEAWMNQGILSHLFLHYVSLTDLGRWEMVAEGSITGATEEYGDISVNLDVGGTGTGDTLQCDADTTFSVEARRSATGRRTALSFTLEGGSCSACTTVGDGEVCIDLAGLLTWDEGGPW